MPSPTPVLSPSQQAATSGAAGQFQSGFTFRSELDKNGAALRRIRVLLVEDNPMVLRQVAEVLPDDVEIVDAIETGAELSAAIEASAPDVIVLDISLPGDSGLTLAARLTAQGCTARIVFLTVHQDPDYVRSALAAGGCGYVVKMRLALDLESALRAAVEGEQFISPIPELRID